MSIRRVFYTGLLGLSIALVSVLSTALLACLFVGGPARFARLIGAGYLLQVEFPSISGFRQEYHAVVIGDAVSVAKYQHIFHGNSVDEASSQLIQGMASAGFELKQRIQHGKNGPSYLPTSIIGIPPAAGSVTSESESLVFASGPNARFCYSVVVYPVRTKRRQEVVADTTYRLFSEKALQADNILRSMLNDSGASATLESPSQEETTSHSLGGAK